MAKQIIVITGGGEGLGKGLAQELNKDSTVIILGRSTEKLEKTASELGCKFYVCDVSDYEHVASTFNQIIAKHEKIDCLINNAGLWIQGELDTSDPKRIQDVINSNTTGTIFCTRAVVPHMKERQRGLIINIISQAGLYAKPERSVYNASKWAITGFTKSLQQELKKYNIRVTGVYPSAIDTSLFKNANFDRNMSDAMSPLEVAEAIRFIIDSPSHIHYPEIGIQNINYN